MNFSIIFMLIPASLAPDSHDSCLTEHFMPFCYNPSTPSGFVFYGTGQVAPPRVSYFRAPARIQFINQNSTKIVLLHP